MGHCGKLRSSVGTSTGNADHRVAQRMRSSSKRGIRGKESILGRRWVWRDAKDRHFWWRIACKRRSLRVMRERGCHSLRTLGMQVVFVVSSRNTVAWKYYVDSSLAQTLTVRHVSVEQP